MEVNIVDSSVHLGVLQALREWRQEESRSLNIPPYWILTQRAMVHIATRLPETMEELAQIRGVGPARVNRYGERIVQVVSEARHTDREVPVPPPPAPTQIQDYLRPTRVSYPIPTRYWTAVLTAAHIAVPGEVAGMDILVALSPDPP